MTEYRASFDASVRSLPGPEPRTLVQLDHAHVAELHPPHGECYAAADTGPTPRSAPSGRLQDQLPKSDTATPRIGQNGPAQAKVIARQNADLLFQRVGEGTRTPGPQDHNLVL